MEAELLEDVALATSWKVQLARDMWFVMWHEPGLVKPQSTSLKISKKEAGQEELRHKIRQEVEEERELLRVHKAAIKDYKKIKSPDGKEPEAEFKPPTKLAPEEAKVKPAAKSASTDVMDMIESGLTNRLILRKSLRS